MIERESIKDERGYFARNFAVDELGKNGLKFNIVQASISFNRSAGTLRGMHFQKDPKSEEKIVQCFQGAIYDVALDLRDGSRTYGEWVAVELSEENGKMFFIPKGFAHGFQTLKNDTLVQYYMSEFYSSEHSSGVRWNDPKLRITWPLPNPKLNDKDNNWPLI